MQTYSPKAIQARKMARRRLIMERLEDRTLLSFTFAYNPVTDIATATGAGAAESLVLEPSGGFLLYSVNGGALSGDWAGSAVPINTSLKVNVGGAAGSTNLTVDLSSNAHAHLLNLSSNGTTSTLHDKDGNLPADINYATASLASLTIDTNPVYNQTLNLDFGGGGNPIPTAAATGLAFNTGDPNAGGLHLLTIAGQLPGGPFASITPLPNDPTVSTKIGKYGSITFDDGTGSATAITKLSYSGLQPIQDTTPAVTYTFNDFGTDGSFTAISGPVVSGNDSIELQSTPGSGAPQFETTDIANKTNVIFNTNQTLGLSAVVNIPTASTGLTSLTFNALTNGNNHITIAALPAGVSTVFNSGTGDDVTNVTGTGIAAGTNLTLTGGDGIDTLNYDAGGLSAVDAAGSSPGEIIIALPGAGTLDVMGYAKINFTNVGAGPITPGSALTLNTPQGAGLSGAVVGTFTLPLPSVGTPPSGVSASDFAATIAWGDGTSNSPGTITQDAGNPSVYYITASHTFSAPGDFTVTNTVAFAGGSYDTTVNGTSISVNLAPAGPTAGTSATATVTGGIITVAADSIVGTSGSAIAAAPVATFTNAGGVIPIGDYSAEIKVINASGTTVVDVAAASITQIGNSAEYTVNAPAMTLTGAGTYQVVVKVTDSLGAYTSTGTGLAVIAGSSTPPAASNILAFAKQPANAVAGATIKPIVVDVEDLLDHTIKTDTSSVTLSIATGPGALIGTKTVSAVNGVATFSNLSIDVAGTYTLTATDGGATKVSKSFTVSAAAVASVVIGAVPGSVTAGAKISPGITAHVFDAFGNPVDGSPGVTITIATGPAGATLSGSVAATAKDGVATFSNVSIHKVGTYAVKVTSHGFSATSGSFTVTPTAAATITFKQIPTTVAAGSPIGTSIIIQVTDQFGNLLANNVNDVTLSLQSGPSGGVLGGTKSVALSGGLATFSNLDLTTKGKYTLLASFGGLSQRHSLTVN